MPWELLVVLIAAIGIFLLFKNRRVRRSIHKRKIANNTIEHRPDATMDTNGYDKGK